MSCSKCSTDLSEGGTIARIHGETLCVDCWRAWHEFVQASFPGWLADSG